MNKIVLAKKLLKMANRLTAANLKKEKFEPNPFPEEFKKKLEKVLDDIQNQRQPAYIELIKAHHAITNALNDNFVAAKKEYQKQRKWFRALLKTDPALQALKEVLDELRKLGIEMAKHKQSMELFVSGLHLVVHKSKQPSQQPARQVETIMRKCFLIDTDEKDYLEETWNYVVEIRCSFLKILQESFNVITLESERTMDFARNTAEKCNRQREKEGKDPIPFDLLFTKYQDLDYNDATAGRFLLKSSRHVNAGFKDVFNKLIGGIKTAWNKITNACAGLFGKVKLMISNTQTATNNLNAVTKELEKLAKN